jgi:LemA protein
MKFELMIFLGIVIVYLTYVYNRLIHLRESIRNDLKQIDIQLDRRYKVFESLISAVAKYLNYEETVLKDVVALRSQAKNAKDSGDESNWFASEGAISKIAENLPKSVNIMMEAYPDLKGSETVMKLMEEIVSTENKLSYAKQSYNDGSERFNAMMQKFPINLFVSNFGFSAFVYWQLSQDDAKSKEDYIAKL